MLVVFRNNVKCLQIIVNISAVYCNNHYYDVVGDIMIYQINMGTGN